MKPYYTIVLDASYDLWMASHPNDDEAVGDFFAAYTDAAEALAAACNFDIDIISGSYTGPAMQGQSVTFKNQEEEETVEQDLWQAIHDCLDQNDKGKWIVNMETVTRKTHFFRYAL